jgi:predicted amidohydrolase YtcJ
MAPLRTIRLLLLGLLVSACGERPAEDQPASPDLILLNARVVTMNPADSVAEAIAVTGAEISAIGSSDELRALAGARTEIVDLGGNTVTPGMIDTHNHFAWGASTAFGQLDLGYPAVTSIADIRELVRQAATEREAGEWILGWGWDGGKLEEGRDVTLADLDDLTPDNPVWLGHTSGHYGVANSKALEVAGIGPDTRAPDGGVIGRGGNGDLTGIITDQARDLIRPFIPDTDENFVEAITALVGDLNATGITTIKDPETYRRHWDAYREVAANGDLTVRVYTLWRVPDTLDEARDLLAEIQPITQPREQDGSELVVSAGVKIYVDGSGTARTAWVYDDWSIDYTVTDEGNTGLTYIETDVLFEQIRLFHNAGIHIGTHAIGDRAIDFTMDAYDRVLADNPVTGLRHSIIHSNLPTEHAMDLMVKLQREFDAGYPEVQPAFLWWIGDTYIGNFGEERSRRVLPLGTFEERGIRWAGSSDFDVSPYAPRHAFYAASARRPMLGTYGDDPWNSRESVGIHDTLRAYTATAARQVFLDDRIGTLEVGKLADIVAWDRDLHAASVDELNEVSPVLTIMNGQTVYRARGRRQ